MCEPRPPPPRCPPQDELQLLLSRVATYRAECDDTRSSLEEAVGGEGGGLGDWPRGGDGG